MFPVGWFLHFCVRGTVTRHAVNIVVGVLGMTYFYGTQIVHVFAMSIVSYLIMVFLPRESQQNVVCFFVFAYLSYSHIDAVLYHFDSYDLTITLNTMLLTLRLQALAFCYRDGCQPKEALTERQELMKIVKLPNPFEMMSYTFYCQQYALGVFFEYRDFKAWIEEREEYQKVPSPVVESLKYAVKGILCIAFYSAGTSFFPMAFCFTHEFAECSLPYKLMYALLTGGFTRYFYYSAFVFQTGAVIASGLGYNGRKEVTGDGKIGEKEGEHQWDKFIGVYL